MVAHDLAGDGPRSAKAPLDRAAGRPGENQFQHFAAFGLAGLCRIDDEACLLFGDQVSCACRRRRSSGDCEQPCIMTIKGSACP